MSHWEGPGKTDHWHTPKYIFDALGCTFDLDVAGPIGGSHVPCKEVLCSSSLEVRWPPQSYVWMNPPFGGRNGLVPWLDKFFAHGNGIALVPDRTSAPWWQSAARRSDAILFVAGKIKFERPDGSVGKHPGNGTTLLAVGTRGRLALLNAKEAGLGFMVETVQWT